MFKEINASLFSAQPNGQLRAINKGKGCKNVETGGGKEGMGAQASKKRRPTSYSECFQQRVVTSD